MAKKIDQFDKFREATLGRSSELSNAIYSRVQTEEEKSPSPADSYSPTPASASNSVQVPVAKVSKNATRELVSFHLDKETKKLLGLLKYESDRSFGDLYIEAIEDLLRKYGKL